MIHCDLSLVSVFVCSMSEYSEKHTVSRLIGAAPGYVGYEDAVSFSNKCISLDKTLQLAETLLLGRVN